MINVSRAILHPKLSQSIQLFRKSGAWVKGRFEQVENSLTMQGVVSPAKPQDIEMIPEGDRVGGEIAIFTTGEVFVTSDSGTSDEVSWNGERYKIYAVQPYRDYGYYKSIAVRKDSR